MGEWIKKKFLTGVKTFILSTGGNFKKVCRYRKVRESPVLKGEREETKRCVKNTPTDKRGTMGLRGKGGGGPNAKKRRHLSSPHMGFGKGRKEEKKNA